MFNNTTGNYNTASGSGALYIQHHGRPTTRPAGYEALNYNTTGNNNTASGNCGVVLQHHGRATTRLAEIGALYSNTTASDNTASGVQRLTYNTTGDNNTASGYNALLDNTTGVNNAAVGFKAMQNNVAGSNNTALGTVALLKSTGSNNIAVGSGAGSSLTTGNNNIDLGSPGSNADAGTLRLGTNGLQTNAYIAGVSGVTVGGGVPVVVDANGHLGTMTSSARFKDDIQSMDAASESILALRPVTFRYKPELDSEGIAQYGLVAEEVEKVNPALVARDAAGKAYTVRYDAINAMLLNEFLKQREAFQQERRRNATALTAQASAIAELKAALTRQQEVTAALAARLEGPAVTIPGVGR